MFYILYKKHYIAAGGYLLLFKALSAWQQGKTKYYKKKKKNKPSIDYYIIIVVVAFKLRPSVYHSVFCANKCPSWRPLSSWQNNRWERTRVTDRIFRTATGPNRWVSCPTTSWQNTVPKCPGPAWSLRSGTIKKVFFKKKSGTAIPDFFF